MLFDILNNVILDNLLKARYNKKKRCDMVKRTFAILSNLI